MNLPSSATSKLLASLNAISPDLIAGSDVSRNLDKGSRSAGALQAYCPANELGMPRESTPRKIKDNIAQFSGALEVRS